MSYLIPDTITRRSVKVFLQYLRPMAAFVFLSVHLMSGPHFLPFLSPRVPLPDRHLIPQACTTSTQFLPSCVSIIFLSLQCFLHLSSKTNSYPSFKTIFLPIVFLQYQADNSIKIPITMQGLQCINMFLSTTSLSGEKELSIFVCRI